tara:strand:- start:86 stop:397 length:312 start_codon:yes stop_codon:yes gene_type:complete
VVALKQITQLLDKAVLAEWDLEEMLMELVVLAQMVLPRQGHLNKMMAVMEQMAVLVAVEVVVTRAVVVVAEAVMAVMVLLLTTQVVEDQEVVIMMDKIYLLLK